MERKLILILLLVGIILIMDGIEKFTVSLHPIHPNGSYKDKCKQVFYDGVILSASCPNLEGNYVNTRFCTSECPCVDRAATKELKCGCSTNNFGVDDNGKLICEK